jgi:hypothetical protein
MANDNDKSMTTSEAGSMSSGKFEKGSKRASEAGKAGAKAQPTEAKQRGGEIGGSHSHRNG